MFGLLSAGSSSAADCAYFRVSQRLDRCRTVDVPAVDRSTRTIAADPLLAEEPERRRSAVKVECACEYELSGTDFRCDFDRMEIYHTTLPTDDPRRTCRKAAKVCRTLCPSQLK